MSYKQLHFFEIFLSSYEIAMEALEGKTVFHEEIKKEVFNHKDLKPVIRTNICTGEQVAGFRDRNTGEFTEIMLIRDSKDLDKFLVDYEVSVAEVAKEW